MLEPKEKAKEIFDKMASNIEEYGWRESAIECAKIAVDEIINCDSFFNSLDAVKEFTKYWYEVQEEINKL